MASSSTAGDKKGKRPDKKGKKPDRNEERPASHRLPMELQRMTLNETQNLIYLRFWKDRLDSRPAPPQNFRHYPSLDRQYWTTLSHSLYFHCANWEDTFGVVLASRTWREIFEETHFPLPARLTTTSASSTETTQSSARRHGQEIWVSRDGYGRIQDLLYFENYHKICYACELSTGALPSPPQYWPDIVVRLQEVFDVIWDMTTKIPEESRPSLVRGAWLFWGKMSVQNVYLNNYYILVAVDPRDPEKGKRALARGTPSSRLLPTDASLASDMRGKTPEDLVAVRKQDLHSHERGMLRVVAETMSTWVNAHPFVNTPTPVTPNEASWTRFRKSMMPAVPKIVRWKKQGEISNRHAAPGLFELVETFV